MKYMYQSPYYRFAGRLTPGLTRRQSLYRYMTSRAAAVGVIKHSFLSAPAVSRCRWLLNGIRGLRAGFPARASAA
jgi:hypothetical protein